MKKCKTIIHHFASIDSTSSFAKREAQKLSRECLTIIRADEQSKGRGRFSHTWLSPACGNLYITFCFYLPSLKEEMAHFSQVICLALVDLLEEYRLSPKIKWPNDLLINQKKIGGVLTETSQVESGWMVFCGIGLNVNMPKELLCTVPTPATSMMQERGVPFDVDEIVEKLTALFLSYKEALFSSGFSSLLPLFETRIAHGPDEMIRFRDGRGTYVEGFYRGLGQDGSLNLRLPSGEDRNFLSGILLDLID